MRVRSGLLVQEARAQSVPVGLSEVPPHPLAAPRRGPSPRYVRCRRYAAKVQQVRIGPWLVWIPETLWERARGLLGRAQLEPNEGLLLERSRSVHTFGMRFAIDAVLLDRDDRVVEVVRLSPNRVLLPRARVRAVLEVAPGEGRRFTPGARVGSTTRDAPNSGRRARSEPPGRRRTRP
jgi:uncharacterized membrane protein (UPF0127 family)